MTCPVSNADEVGGAAVGRPQRRHAGASAGVRLKQRAQVLTTTSRSAGEDGGRRSRARLASLDLGADGLLESCGREANDLDRASGAEESHDVAPDRAAQGGLYLIQI